MHGAVRGQHQYLCWGGGGTLSAWDWEGLGGTGSPDFSPWLLSLMHQARTGEGKDTTAVPSSREGDLAAPRVPGLCPRMAAGLGACRPAQRLLCPPVPPERGDKAPRSGSGTGGAVAGLAGAERSQNKERIAAGLRSSIRASPSPPPRRAGSAARASDWKPEPAMTLRAVNYADGFLYYFFFSPPCA